MEKKGKLTQAGYVYKSPIKHTTVTLYLLLKHLFPVLALTENTTLPEVSYISVNVQ